MATIPKFLRKEGDTLYFNQDNATLIFYIPELYFERNFANVVGDIINLIGIFNYTIEEDNGKNNGLHTFNFPTVFLTQPGEVQKIRNVKLTKTTDNTDYRLLKFSKGDKVVVSTKVPKDIINAELFYKMFTTGKIPTTTPYVEMQNYFMDNIKLTGNKYSMNYQLFGIIAAEMCRSPRDPKVLFRHTKMDDMTGYKMISIKDAPRYISAFTAINSEVKEEAIANSIINSAEDKNHKYSPLERLFTESAE